MSVRGAALASAEQFARAHGFNSVRGIPESQREAAIHSVAQSLGVDRSEIQLHLSIHWNETRGRAGGALTGDAASSSIQGRSRAGLGALDVRLAQSKRPKQGDDGVLRKPKDIARALVQGDGARIADQGTLTMRTELARKNVAFDEHVIQPGLFDAPDKKPRVGEWGTLRLADLPDDDPILDMPIFRGMGSADPATHALDLTGRLIPQGREDDYERFKTYSHKGALDAYEWSLDPYVALKATGGHGQLVQTTLRELKDQNVRRIYRQAGDTEGGIFIADTIQPRARTIRHGANCYELDPMNRPRTRDNERKFARLLSKIVPEKFGSWDAFMDSGHKATGPMKKAKHSSLVSQLAFWVNRLEALDPNSQLPEQVRDRAMGVPVTDLDKRIKLLGQLNRKVKSAVVSASES